MAKEQYYQKRISDKYTNDGWFVIKLIRTNVTGIPDLLCLKDGEKPLFIECKTEKGRLSKIQEYILRKLIDSKFNVAVSYGNEIKFLN